MSTEKNNPASTRGEEPDYQLPSQQGATPENSEDQRESRMGTHSQQYPQEASQEEDYLLPKSSAVETIVPIFTGIITAGVFIICYLIDPVALLGLMILGLLVAAQEFFTVMRKVGYQPAILLGLTGVAGLSLGAYFRGVEAYPLILGIIVFVTFLWFLLVANDQPAVPNIGATLLVVVYVGVLGSFAALLLAHKDGDNLLVAAVLAAVSYDVGGWVIGKLVGRTLFTSVSPNKTLEGLMGGMLMAIVVPVVVLQFLELEPWGADPGELKDVLLLGIVAAIVAPLGDLNESLLKRSMNVKDMGTILPGHGGVLDRIDALLFVMPASYILARTLEIIEFAA